MVMGLSFNLRYRDQTRNKKWSAGLLRTVAVNHSSAMVARGILSSYIYHKKTSFQINSFLCRYLNVKVTTKKERNVVFTIDEGRAAHIIKLRLLLLLLCYLRNKNVLD